MTRVCVSAIEECKDVESGAANPTDGYFFGRGALTEADGEVLLAVVAVWPLAALRNTLADTPSMAEELRTFRSTAAFRLAGAWR